jgi:tRNA modification GTPase
VTGLRFARLTARGEAAVALFRVRGEATEELLARLFRPRRAGPLRADEVRFGALLDGDSVLDEALVRVRRREDGLEADISVHGSAWVVGRLEALLSEAGGRPLAPHEAWDLGRSSGAAPDDRVTAEARGLLLGAYAALQASFFLHAVEGSLSRELRSLERSLRGEPPAPPAAVHERVATLLRRAPFGRAMAKPPAVLLLGAPNAGKSTLFNALLGESRAIVSEQPGTTRDLVSEAAVFADLPFRLSDSAGIRPSRDPVEQAGVARAKDAAEGADIVLVLIDPEGDLLAQARLAASVPRGIAVVSKADLAGAAAALSSGLVAALRPSAVSARTGEGIPGLRARIVDRSAFGGVAEARQVAPFLERHVAALAACEAALRAGRTNAAAAGELGALEAPEKP